MQHDFEVHGSRGAIIFSQERFNDLKAIEARDFLRALAGDLHKGPDFREGYEIQMLVELAYRSARERRWLEV